MHGVSFVDFSKITLNFSVLSIVPHYNREFFNCRNIAKNYII